MNLMDQATITIIDGNKIDLCHLKGLRTKILIGKFWTRAFRISIDIRPLRPILYQGLKGYFFAIQNQKGSAQHRTHVGLFTLRKFPKHETLD